MRIVVTGASGSIGSAIAALLGNEHKMVGIDLRSGPRVTHLHDICDGQALSVSLAGADAVVHVAALHDP
jgi:nucleoside-diphosphate-sugar epimerase